MLTLLRWKSTLDFLIIFGYDVERCVSGMTFREIPNPEDFYVESEDEEYLVEVLIDIHTRQFSLFSSHGDVRTIKSVSMSDFLDTLEAIRFCLDEDDLFYTKPKLEEDFK